MMEILAYLYVIVFVAALGAFIDRMYIRKEEGGNNALMGFVFVMLMFMGMALSVGTIIT